jgi:hypothetical protein
LPGKCLLPRKDISNDNSSALSDGFNCLVVLWSFI